MKREIPSEINSYYPNLIIKCYNQGIFRGFIFYLSDRVVIVLFNTCLR